MATVLTINVQAVDDAGGVATGTGQITLVSAPVIQSVVVTPPTLPAGGGTAVVRINAVSPDGRPLTYTAVPSPGNGTVQPGSVPNEFIWRVP